MNKLHRTLLLAWTVFAAVSTALTGCSSEGGVVGSGISSVSGNVIQVELESPGDGGAAALAAPTVSVSIDEAPGIETLTGADGAFTLEGDFSGDVTLRFRTADRSTDLATRELNVPEGASVVLEDIGVAPGVVDVAAERIVEFRGEVESTDCPSATVVVVDDSRRGNRFAMTLIGESEIVTRDGAPLSCSELRAHARVLVEHAVPAGGSAQITALRVVVSPPPPDGPRSIPVHLRGHAIDVNCETGRIRIDDERLRDHRARLVVSEATSFVCDGAPCTCEDVAAGDGLRVDAVIFANDPRAIQAQRIERSMRPDVVRVHVAGPVVAKDCTRGGFLVEDPRYREIRIPVQVRPETRFECNGRPDLPCSCEALRVRESVAVDGVLGDRNAAPVVRAELVRVRRGGPPPARTPAATRTPQVMHTRRPTRTPKPMRVPPEEESQPRLRRSTSALNSSTESRRAVRSRRPRIGPGNQKPIRIA